MTCRRCDVITSVTISMENQVRIFRKNPIAWWDKNAMRYLRRKYGKVKKTFALLRAVYLALCEIESDFSDSPINFFTQTVGTYAGTSRQVAGKYINMLEKDGLVSKVRMRDEKTKKYLPGTFIEILDFDGVIETKKPLAGYPTSGVSQQRDTLPSIKKISITKKINTNTVNGVVKGGEKSSLHKLPDLGEPPEKTAYLAQQILKELGDEKSQRFYHLVAAKIPEGVIRETLSEVRVDGARDPAKLFTYKIQRYALTKQKL
jgi:hypothetical protein